jgi:tetratricopeptide (TPR) repeat protein
MNTPGFLDVFAAAERPNMEKAKKLSVGFALLLFLVTGCAKNQQDVSKLSNDKANSLSAQHSKFEKSKDPPFTAATHFAAGQLAESQEAPMAAIAHYQAALRIDSRHRDSLYRMGVVYTKLKDWPNAIGTWKRYLKQTKNDATAYANLGFCYDLAGRKSDAERTYQDGIAKNPTNVNCRVNYGLLLAREGRTEEAAAQWRAVLTEAQVHYNLGSMYEQQNKREQARLEFRQALQHDQNLVDARTRLAALD